MSLKRYSDKELQVFLWVIFPYTIGMNFIMFGECLFSDASIFAVAGGLSVLYLFFSYSVFGIVATLVQKRFPSNHDLFKRVGLMLPIFYMMNVLLVTGLYSIYNLIRPFACLPGKGSFLWAVAFGCLASTVITFLNEAMSNWDKWKAAITETEQLKNAFQKTRLLGLKGQINPHFLFNCFNSLSSLISEDEEKAEKFLDEMTKVHRYMLRGDDDQLVRLRDELRFVQSYMYLTNVRFGDAIRYSVDAGDDLCDQLLPPLSLQAILENIIYTNTASKASPLHLSITVAGASLVVRHTLQPKLRKDGDTFDEGLDNVITKYKLLHVREVEVRENGSERVVILPLLNNGEVVS